MMAYSFDAVSKNWFWVQHCAWYPEEEKAFPFNIGKQREIINLEIGNDHKEEMEMNSEKIMSFLQEHRNACLFAIGVLLLVGAMMNWNWLCDPTGAPHANRYDRGSRRRIFLLLGMLLIVVSIWEFVLGLK